MKRIAYTGKEVTASGPYSHAIDGGEYIYFSGQTAMNGIDYNPETPKGTIAEQTELAFANLKSVLEAADLTFDNVLKVNVYLTTMANFVEMNNVYSKYFEAPYPARTCVAVLELPLGADVEIELVAKR